MHFSSKTFDYQNNISSIEEMDSRKRVLIIAADFKPMIGGVSEYAYQMATAFKRIGNEVMILAPHYPGDDCFDRKSGLHIKRTYPPAKTGSRLGVIGRLGKVASLTSLAVAMLKAHNSFSPHIVYLPCLYPFGAIFPYSRESLVVTFHGGELSTRCQASRFAGIHRRILARSCRNSSLILANSNYTRSLLKDMGIDTSKVFVTGCGVNWQRFSHLYDMQEVQEVKERLGFTGKKIIFSLGRLDERKGFDTVIKCIPKIREKEPNVLYVIAGGGPMRTKLEMLVDELDLHNHVRLVGRISDKDVVDYMAACDIFAMPNRETASGSVEGFGIVFLEASCCGKPVIAGRNGGAVDAVEHKKTGLLVDPYSQQAIEDAIETLLRKPQLAAKLGQQGRERVERHFKWAFIADRVCRRILRQLG